MAFRTELPVSRVVADLGLAAAGYGVVCCVVRDS